MKKIATIFFVLILLAVLGFIILKIVSTIRDEKNAEKKLTIKEQEELDYDLELYNTYVLENNENLAYATSFQNQQNAKDSMNNGALSFGRRL